METGLYAILEMGQGAYALAGPAQGAARRGGEPSTYTFDELKAFLAHYGCDLEAILANGDGSFYYP